MTDLAPSGTTAVVFCGGRHSRFDRLAGLQAKTLLVAYDSPLLWRLLDQLRAAGFSDVVASTTPSFGEQIRASTTHYTRVVTSEIHIDVVVSEAQQRGVVFGMRDVFHAASTDRCLICLGDIFFVENPFPAFRARLEADEDAVGTAPLAADSRTPASGLIYKDREHVRQLVERPVSVPAAGAVRWSGVVLSDRRRALADLEAYVPDLAPDVPLGEFLEFQRQRGRAFRAIAGPDFVNVNAPDQLLLASLHARLAQKPDLDPTAQAAVARAQDALRRCGRGTTAE